MKKYTKLFFVFAFSTSLFFSCSDDDDTTDKKDDDKQSTNSYFTMPTASYRIMKSTDSDNTVTYDSVVVTATGVDKDGKSATTLSSFSSNVDTEFDVEASNNFYNNSEAGKLYVHANFFDGMLSKLSDVVPLPLKFKEWYLIANENASSDWEIFSQKLDNIPITILGSELSITGDFKIIGKKVKTEDITVNDVLYSNALKVEFSVGMANASTVIFGTEQEVTLTSTVINWYVDGIGIVQTENSDVDATLAKQPSPVLGGSTSIMIRTNLPITD